MDRSVGPPTVACEASLAGSLFGTVRPVDIVVVDAVESAATDSVGTVVDMAVVVWDEGGVVESTG